MMMVIWGWRETKYFFGEDWTTQIRLNRLGNFPIAKIVCTICTICTTAICPAPFSLGSIAYHLLSMIPTTGQDRR
jgi:hypothetical protein